MVEVGELSGFGAMAQHIVDTFVNDVMIYDNWELGIWGGRSKVHFGKCTKNAQK